MLPVRAIRWAARTLPFMVRHMHRLDSLRAAGIGVEARQGAVFACGKMFLFGIEAYLDPAPHVRAAVVEVEVCGRNRTNGGRRGSEHGLGSACENTSSMMSARAKLTHLCMPFAATYARVQCRGVPGQRV